MKVYNNTPTDVAYDVSWANAGDCGSLGMGETFESTDWDNQENVRVSFNPLSAEPAGAGANPFSIMVDQTGQGMAVTIGIYSE